MRRNDFIKRLIQLALLGILTLVAVLLGGKTVKEDDCYVCPGKGICRGENDCSIYKINKDGRA
jgi:hypothetical protein